MSYPEPALLQDTSLSVLSFTHKPLTIGRDFPDKLGSGSGTPSSLLIARPASLRTCAISSLLCSSEGYDASIAGLPLWGLPASFPAPVPSLSLVSGPCPLSGPV